MFRNMKSYWDREWNFLADNPQEGEMILAEKTVSSEDILWEENDDGKIEVRGYEGKNDSANVKRIKIPETIGGKQVAIISYGFEDDEYLLSIEIPDSVGVIRENAFCGCTRLEKITVAESNPAYETDDAGVLYNKGKSILIYCPAEVKEVSIPDSVRMIEDFAFYDCYKLEKITVDKGNPAYESDDAGVLYNKGKTTLHYCPPRCKETSIKIPDSVNIIEGDAFFDCESLTSVDIPESITHIEESAFYGCKSLLEIEIPGGMTRIEDYTFADCKSLTSVDIPESVTHIEEGAFYGCENLLSINISGNVTCIEKNTFQKCISLENINLPSSVSSIGEEAFSECFSLSNINIPGSVIHIGKNAFCRCTNLTSINIPSSVSSIGEGAFMLCHKLEKIIVDESNPVYESDDAGVLYNKGKTALICCPAGTKETSINIPSSVNVIESDAFLYCKSLTSVEIPSGITCIEAGTFENCESLTNIEVPKGVSSIGWKAFGFCKNLLSVGIPDSVNNIKNIAFIGCKSLKKIEIPEGVSNIRGTFFGCKSLESIKIPVSVSYIEGSSLGECTSLKDVYYAGSREQWDAIEIDMDGNDALGSATIHYGSN